MPRPPSLAEALAPFALGADLAALSAKDLSPKPPLTPQCIGMESSASTMRPAAPAVRFSGRTVAAGIACLMAMAALAAVYAGMGRNRGQHGGLEGPAARERGNLPAAEAKDSAAAAGQAVAAPPPLPVLPSLDAIRARKLQETCAAALGIPVVQSNSLGMKLVLDPAGRFRHGLGKDRSRRTAKR